MFSQNSVQKEQQQQVTKIHFLNSPKIKLVTYIHYGFVGLHLFQFEGLKNPLSTQSQKLVVTQKEL